MSTLWLIAFGVEAVSLAGIGLLIWFAPEMPNDNGGFDA